MIVAVGVPVVVVTGIGVVVVVLTAAAIVSGTPLLERGVEYPAGTLFTVSV